MTNDELEQIRQRLREIEKDLAETSYGKQFGLSISAYDGPSEYHGSNDQISWNVNKKQFEYLHQTSCNRLEDILKYGIHFTIKSFTINSMNKDQLMCFVERCQYLIHSIKREYNKRVNALPSALKKLEGLP